MKLCVLLFAAGSLALPVFAADPSPSKAATAEVDLSSFKTADELWKHVQKLQEPPATRPKTRDEAMQRLAKQTEAAKAFLEKYPDDERKWDAKLLTLRTGFQRKQMSGDSLEAEKKAIEEILAAPDASADVKGEAAFFGVMLHTNDFDEKKPATYSAFHKAAGEFLEKYPSHKLAPQIRMIQLQVLSSVETPESEALLKQIARGADKQMAVQAKEALAQRKKMAELKTKPVELKFTATNGAEIDLAKMRGKVVLVDFWASWCGPCIGELPNVVATYKKLHDKGFEIVGISLDQDKGKMEAATAKLGMSWPQHFDGKGWQNTISSSFGIRSIPAAWLLDKKGMLRESELRGEALGQAVEKLLAE